jgi:hypothetical protein
MISYLIERLSENSTWRGIVMLLTVVGVQVDPAQANAIIAAGLALIGLINVFRKQAK